MKKLIIGTMVAVAVAAFLKRRGEPKYIRLFDPNPFNGKEISVPVSDPEEAKKLLRRFEGVGF